MNELTDHYAWAEAVTAELDSRIRIDRASTESVAAQGIVHALLAIADQLDGIRELIETDGEKVRHLFEPPSETPTVCGSGEPYPGP